MEFGGFDDSSSANRFCYFFSSTSMVCEQGNWLGDVKCKLDPSIVQEKCEISFDDPNVPSVSAYSILK